MSALVIDSSPMISKSRWDATAQAAAEVRVASVVSILFPLSSTYTRVSGGGHIFGGLIAGRATQQQQRGANVGEEVAQGNSIAQKKP